MSTPFDLIDSNGVIVGISSSVADKDSLPGYIRCQMDRHCEEHGGTWETNHDLRIHDRLWVHWLPAGVDRRLSWKWSTSRPEGWEQTREIIGGLVDYLSLGRSVCVWPTAPESDDERWFQGPVECRLCGHRQTSVVPVSGGEEDDVLTRLECSNCGNMTGEATHE